MQCCASHLEIWVAKKKSFIFSKSALFIPVSTRSIIITLYFEQLINGFSQFLPINIRSHMQMIMITIFDRKKKKKKRKTTLNSINEMHWLHWDVEHSDLQTKAGTKRCWHTQLFQIEWTILIFNEDNFSFEV